MAKATTMGPMKIKESASYRVFKVFNAIILTLILVVLTQIVTRILRRLEVEA